jgi:hypothetical protein
MSALRRREFITLLGGPTLLNGTLKLKQTAPQLISLAFGLIQFGREGVALALQRGILRLGGLPGVGIAAYQDPATVGVARLSQCPLRSESDRQTPKRDLSLRAISRNGPWASTF